MKRTLARIVLAALVADVVGTILILLFAATFTGSTTETPILSYAGLAGAMLAIGGVLALPTAALGVVLGDLMAPPAGISRTVVFAALGAGLGAFMGTPMVGGSADSPAESSEATHAGRIRSPTQKARRGASLRSWQRSFSSARLSTFHSPQSPG